MSHVARTALPSTVQQEPLRNPSFAGVNVLAHSGEFAPRVADLTGPGRGESFAFVRRYRSGLAGQRSALGRGWSWTYDKRLEAAPDRDGIRYEDGSGGTHHFARRADGTYDSPPGMYATLVQESGGQGELRLQHGGMLRFAPLADGGRLSLIADPSGNSLSFAYAADGSGVTVTDALGLEYTVAHDDGLITGLTDPWGRSWTYHYDSDDRLIRIGRPASQGFPQGTSIRYGYGPGHRLTSITNPAGATFLRNTYDNSGRIVQQHHGSGVFAFSYEEIAKGAEGRPVHATTAVQKNGARLHLVHDEAGHAVQRTLFVAADTLSAGDRDGQAEGLVPLSTSALYNRHGELVRSTDPAGVEAEWEYDEAHPDPRARGNLLRETRRPAADTNTDQSEVSTHYSYEPRHQRRARITDPRGNSVHFEYDPQGNLTARAYEAVTVPDLAGGPGARPHREQLVDRFAHNTYGQLTRAQDARGSVTEYRYYPAADPFGRSGVPSDGGGGLLAQEIRDPRHDHGDLPGPAAHVVTRYVYDPRGNLASVIDGRGNGNRMLYDGLDQMIAATPRGTHPHKQYLEYDANGDAISVTAVFERNVLTDKGEVREQLTESVVRAERDDLGALVRRTTTVDGREISETFTRDANGNLVRYTDPLGQVTAYHYDERSLLTVRVQGEGSEAEATTCYTWTRTGLRRSATDPSGATTTHVYDGLQRYRGFTNAVGTTKRQSYDPAGNITRIEVSGHPGRLDDDGNLLPSDPEPLLTTVLHYDEMGRPIRVDRGWLGPDGAPLGASSWDGAPGRVSELVQYGADHQPAAHWTENGNLQRAQYDGAGRLTTLTEADGGRTTLGYDANGNPVLLERHSPDRADSEEPEVDVVEFRYDDEDRLTGVSSNGEPPYTLAHSAVGTILRATDPAGATVHYLHDTLGRTVGQVTDALDEQASRHVEYDDAGRIVARIDETGRRTGYTYDTLHRRTAVSYPDGAVKRLRRDARGALIGIDQPDGSQVRQRFDAVGRLADRVAIGTDGEEHAREDFRYDGLGRLVAALTPQAPVRRTYDSLSRPLTEQQGAHSLSWEYSPAGDVTTLAYPSGLAVRRTHDRLGRIVDVTGDGRPVAAYDYRLGLQLAGARLGDILDVSFLHKSCLGCLREVTYRQRANDRLLDGHRYEFDTVGNRTAEIRLHEGDRTGDSWSYDALHRLVSAREAVERLDDPDSPFARRIDYRLGQVGSWLVRTVTTADGSVLRDDTESDDRHAYRRLGEQEFSYDRNGNRTLETRPATPDSPLRSVRYRYDHAQRLVRAEFLDDGDTILRTLRYTYDAFGRQVRRVATDTDGGTQTVQRVWNGSQLIEEYEGDGPGRLVRTWIYGARAGEPVSLTLHAEDGSTKTYYYTHNGRGFCTALVAESGEVSERFHYDAFRTPRVVERDGHPVTGEDRASALGAVVLAGAAVWDADLGVHFGLGRAYDPRTGTALNPESSTGEVGCGNTYSSGQNPTSSPKGGGFDPTLADSADGGTGQGGTTVINNYNCIAIFCNQGQGQQTTQTEVTGNKIGSSGGGGLLSGIGEWVRSIFNGGGGGGRDAGTPQSGSPAGGNSGGTSGGGGGGKDGGGQSSGSGKKGGGSKKGGCPAGGSNTGSGSSSGSGSGSGSSSTGTGSTSGTGTGSGGTTGGGDGGTPDGGTPAGTDGGTAGSTAGGSHGMESGDTGTDGESGVSGGCFNSGAGGSDTGFTPGDGDGGSVLGSFGSLTGGRGGVGGLAGGMGPDLTGPGGPAGRCGVGSGFGGRGVNGLGGLGSPGGTRTGCGSATGLGGGSKGSAGSSSCGRGTETGALLSGLWHDDRLGGPGTGGPVIVRGPGGEGPRSMDTYGAMSHGGGGYAGMAMGGGYSDPPKEQYGTGLGVIVSGSAFAPRDGAYSMPNPETSGGSCGSGSGGSPQFCAKF